MEIRFLRKSGVPAAEISAHQQIQKAFDSSTFTKAWRGYASFKLARGGSGAGDDDFDLVLVTHTCVVVIELKNWHGKSLTSHGGHWYVDGNDRGASPVELVNEKAKKLASRMRQRLGNERTPYVNSFVVIQDGIEELELSNEDESRSVLYLYELLEWSKRDAYDKALPWRPRFNVLSNLAAYDQFFGGNDFRPKDYIVEGYRPGDNPIWEHPGRIYAEFRARAKDDPDQFALLRQWNFSAMGPALIGEGDRAFIGLREQRIYEYVAERNEELSLGLLRPVGRKSEADVTLDFAELYALPSKLVRLTEFGNSVLPRLTPDERVLLVKALLSRFADLHEVSIAHRDVAEHSLWLERPAKVVITGFPAAYYPSMQTVGAFREQVKVERANLPEDSGLANEGTPYTRDVYLLGVQVHLLLFGERPPKVRDVYEWAPRAEQSYGGTFDTVLARALEREPVQRFANAREMLEAVNAATSSASQQAINLDRFEAYRAETKQRDYDETEVLADEDDLLFYRSKGSAGDLAVKCWLGIEPDARKPELSLRLLAFLERARTLQGCSLPGLPRIVDFGLSRRSLLLICEWIDGQPLKDWLAKGPRLEDRLSIASGLVDTLSRIHALELAHGDVHPENVVVDSGGRAFFIDAFDFRRGTQDAYTTVYLPPTYKSLTPMERDRYGVAAVIAEVLGGTKAAPDGPFAIPSVYEQLRRLLSDLKASALEPLQRALAKAAAASDKETPAFTVTVQFLSRRGVPVGAMHPDNGVFHVSVERSKKKAGDVPLWFMRVTGVGRQVTFDWNLEQDAAHNVWAGPITQAQLMWAQVYRDSTLDARIELADGAASDVDDLARAVLGLPEVSRKVAVPEPAKPAGATPVATPSASAQDVVAGAPAPTATLPVSIPELWQALLDAEEDALPMVTVSGERRANPERRAQLLVPYHLDSGGIDYDGADTVVIEFLGTDKNWRPCGYLSLRDTTFGDQAELAIDDFNNRTNLRIGERLRLRSTLEKASFSRRSQAVQRVLNDKAVIPELTSYFNPTASTTKLPLAYPPPTDADLDVYADGDKQLNASQREAFRKVLGNGPISLLQGPPGTGKTWFIASLLHYLMTKQQSRRILLVSQSHEAVNNALEKALELCREKGITFDAVRLGHESAASDRIRHLHSGSIEQAYRERFKAEQRLRITRLAVEMGLPEAFARDFVELHQRLGGLAARIGFMAGEVDAAPEGAERSAATARLKSLLGSFDDICRDLYDEPVDGVPATVIANLESRLIGQHSVASPDAVHRLRKLIRLSEDWLAALGSPQANFSEFLAKSRTVVAGTLVGVGHRASGVVQNLYDWVIIDEAGRAAPSELAVAMQTGHRILLVGDHKQLPPTFSQEVREAIRARYSVDDDSPVFGSDFERIFESAYGQRVGASLLRQYRMAPHIGELVSDCFYDGRLETGREDPPSYYSKLPSVLAHQVNWVDTTPLGTHAHEQVTNLGDQRWNELEAKVVMGVLRQLVESHDFMDHLVPTLEPGEPAIGIICMYSRQREVLDRMRAEATWLGNARRLVKIDTVDSYQGKENRVVILSTVRNNDRGQVGFLSSPNRTNVALSRAMDRLFIVGASAMWNRKNSDLPLGRVLSKVQEMSAEGRATMLSAKEFLQ
jgi:serine/threonine protein kinase